MSRVGLLCLVASLRLFAADELVKPEKITIHTWLREDMFAGWIAHDDATFQRGVQKLDRYLKDHPDDQDALSWKYLVLSYEMRTAREKHDDKAYAAALATARDLQTRLLAMGDKNPVPYIILSACLIVVADIAPPADRDWMRRQGRDMLVKIPDLQGPQFEQLPPHLRGEFWAQLAFVSDRLGDTAARDQALEQMQTKLAGTPYETRARAWKNGTAIAKEKQYACISCHEPGRLAPTLARVTGKGN